MSKWLDISELVYADLSSYANLTALLSNAADSIYPLIANADEGDAFLIYYASYEGSPSKDGVYSYSITINAFAKTYNEAVAIADEVTEAIKASVNKYTIGNGRPVFNEQDEFYIEQIFNIKK